MRVERAMKFRDKNSINTFNNLSLFRKISLIRLKKRIKKVRINYENKRKY